MEHGGTERHQGLRAVMSMFFKINEGEEMMAAFFLSMFLSGALPNNGGGNSHVLPNNGGGNSHVLK
jgi:hypothetical protein